MCKHWPTAPKEITLPKNEVHVYSVSLDCSQAKRDTFWTMLSGNERDRAKRFYFDHDRHHYIVARGTLRVLNGRYLSLSPSQIQFTYGEHGKPALAAQHNQNNNILEFNLSHAHGMALVGFSWNRPLGIDIEPVRPLDDAENIASRFFSAWEYEQYTAVSDQDKPQAFFNCWTRKEAYIKAIGDGLTCPLNAFDLTLTPGKPANLLKIRGSQSEAAKWQLHSLLPYDNYIGAIIAKGKDWQLQKWHWAT